MTTQFAQPHVDAHWYDTRETHPAVAMAIQFVVVLKFFPETKGIALEDMELSISR